MYCPTCRTEYREGFTRCHDCNIPLVNALPLEPVPEFTDFTEVLATYNPGDIAFIRSVLEGEEIDYFFKGGHLIQIAPLAEPARLMVRKDQAERVRELFSDVHLSYVGINLDEDLEEDEDVEEDAEDIY